MATQPTVAQALKTLEVLAADLQKKLDAAVEEVDALQAAVDQVQDAIVSLQDIEGTIS